VAALVPRAEIEGDMGDSHVGLQARLMSQALRKLAGAIKKSNTAVIFKIKKNKVAPPFREAEFDILYNEGISVEGDVLDVATDLEIVTKRGAYYSYGDIRLGQGREKAKQFLRENPEILAEIAQARDAYA